MLFTVYEVAEILGCKPLRIYYDLRMFNVRGILVLSSWRLSEEDIWELYDNYKGTKQLACDFGRDGVAERLARVKQEYSQNPCRSAFARIQRRGEFLVRGKGGPDRVARKTKRLKQLELWDDDFWAS